MTAILNSDRSAHGRKRKGSRGGRRRRKERKKRGERECRLLPLCFFRVVDREKINKLAQKKGGKGRTGKEEAKKKPTSSPYSLFPTPDQGEKGGEGKCYKSRKGKGGEKGGGGGGFLSFSHLWPHKRKGRGVIDQ